MVEAFLTEGVRCSDDTTGELLCPLEILRRAPALASAVLVREGSASLLIITASRLLEAAARLDDALDRKKLELDNCMHPHTNNKSKVKRQNQTEHY